MTPRPQPGGTRPGGLRNPAAAIRGLGALTLLVEAVVLLLALAPIRMLGVPRAGLTMVVVASMALVCVVLAAMMSRRWAWWAGLGVQVAVIAAGVLAGWLAVIGGVFALVWTYVLWVRHSVLG